MLQFSEFTLSMPKCNDKLLQINIIYPHKKEKTPFIYPLQTLKSHIEVLNNKFSTPTLKYSSGFSSLSLSGFVRTYILINYDLAPRVLTRGYKSSAPKGRWGETGSCPSSLKGCMKCLQPCAAEAVFQAEASIGHPVSWHGVIHIFYCKFFKNNPWNIMLICISLFPYLSPDIFQPSSRFI